MLVVRQRCMNEGPGRILDSPFRGRPLSMSKPAFRLHAARWTLTLVCLAPAAPSAAVVDIAFDAQGRFAHAATIPPGKFVEICGRLPSGARVGWSFEAQEALDFNIHFHVGDKVEFPEKRAGVDRLSGVLETRSPQDYCWMWNSGAQSPVALRVELLTNPPGR